MIKQYEIVEYHPKYAAAVAEMWNNSQDGWGGGNTIQTEEQVLKQEANSTNLHLFLALDGEKVVGYCSLGEYREDEGALYIPLLNVRGDYHGKKVGKLLVLKALERAIEMKWPRLDLYTWPGNTKAVPLYKKCGFFWEEREDTTHLMNFMPSVLHTEAVKEFFQDVDWYSASTRLIEVSPDGKKENGFDYYEYSWSDNGRCLKMEFERSGRGIRAIETDDYRISASIEQFKLVFGSEYQIRYHIKNKSGRPLEISFLGEHHKNIRFNFERAITVKDDITIDAPFYLDKIDEDQNLWRTHPTVNTKVMINGKAAFFKIGLMPKFPANIACKTIENLTYLGNKGTIYVDLENNFEEEIEYSFVMPESELIVLDERKYFFKLGPKSKCSIPIRYTLKRHGYYSHEVEITAKKSDQTLLVFSKKIGFAFKGIGARFAGENEHRYEVFNGQFQMWLDKFDNWLIPGKEETKDQASMFMYPKLGKPFSEEFSKIRAERVQFMEEGSWIGFRATFQSKAFPDIKLHKVAKLYSEGLVEHHYEIENTSEHETAEEIWLTNPIYQNLERAVIPYENDMIEMKDTIGSFHEYWKGDSITENWIFSRISDDSPRGICWSPAENVHFSNWYIYFEHRIGRMEANETVATNPVYLSFGAFHDWHSFREFAMQQRLEKEPLTEHLAFKLNGGNPFIVGETVAASVKEYKASYLNGSMNISACGKELLQEKVSKDDHMKTKDLLVDVSCSDPVGVMSANIKYDSVETEARSLFIKKGSAPINFKTGMMEGIETFVCSNGPIEITAAPTFYPNLFSLKANGKEWLDTSFPRAKSKSWWNPWPGGIGSALRDISPNSILKENAYAERAKLFDSKGNEWEGLKLIVKLKEHEKYSGVEFHQYFLLLPGVPILCHTAQIINHSGQLIDMKKWGTNCFLLSGDEMYERWGNFQGIGGEWQKLHGGKGEQEMRVGRSAHFGTTEHTDILQVITDLQETKLGSYINKEVMLIAGTTKLNIENRHHSFASPIFFLINDEVIEDDALSSLKAIHFNELH
ncbi:GNAT family N-acetyltransferase [Falsibacillus albus]|nr:GNAT family N-acetyltransferase [Falsibacillus albus]